MYDLSLSSFKTVWCTDVCGQRFRGYISGRALHRESSRRVPSSYGLMNADLWIIMWASFAYSTTENPGMVSAYCQILVQYTLYSILV